MRSGQLLCFLRVAIYCRIQRITSLSSTYTEMYIQPAKLFLKLFSCLERLAKWKILYYLVAMIHMLLIVPFVSFEIIKIRDNGTVGNNTSNIANIIEGHSIALSVTCVIAFCCIRCCPRMQTVITFGQCVFRIIIVLRFMCGGQVCTEVEIFLKWASLYFVLQHLVLVCFSISKMRNPEMLISKEMFTLCFPAIVVLGVTATANFTVLRTTLKTFDYGSFAVINLAMDILLASSYFVTMHNVFFGTKNGVEEDRLDADTEFETLTEIETSGFKKDEIDNVELKVVIDEKSETADEKALAAAAV